MKPTTEDEEEVPRDDIAENAPIAFRAGLLLALAFMTGEQSSHAAERAAAPTRPNIVLLLVDDLGWSDLGCYDADLHETPNIDRFAQTGVRFTDAYAASPVCSPTRASIMTGKHPARLHMTTWYGDSIDPNVNKEKNAKLIPPDSEHNLPHEEMTLAEVLKQAGYFTAHVGKWHLGDPDHGPRTHGFDLNIGGTFSGCPASFFHPFIDADRNPMPNLQSGSQGDYLTDRLTDEALTILDREKDGPFFLQLAYYSVHTPIQGKPELTRRYKQKIEGELLHRNADYAAMVHSVDESVGRILHKLDELKISDRTAVILFSDNGGAHYRGITNNSPLRKGKGTLYEGGIRVPLVVRWPGVARAGAVCRHPVMSTDLYPTILDMASLQGNAEQNVEVDGVSLVPVLKDASATLNRNALYFHFPHYYYGMNTPVSSIRRDDWKLMEYLEDGRVELYHLGNDLGEKDNLAATEPETVDELRRQLHAWRRRLDAPMPEHSKGRVLWQIGKVDQGTAEFALGPKGYGDYRSDGVFVVGYSDSKVDWPYVHPGPDDAWAGGSTHTFVIHFGLKEKPRTGSARLVIDLADTQNFNPPRLTVKVNGKSLLQQQTPCGASDVSICGEPAKGKPHQLSVAVPADALRAGDNQIEIVNSAGSWVLYDALRMEGSADMQSADVTAETRAAVEKQKQHPERVIVVFKTHFDIGYTALASDVVKDYRTTMIDRATEVIEQNRRRPAREQFAWTLPGWPLAQILWDGQTAQRRQAVERALRDGHLVAHALPFTTHTGTLELEDLVRGLGFSSQLSRQYGLELPRDAKMTDVPCHSWVMPTLLKHAGIEFFHIGCNDASMPPDVPLLFWWVGPDGSRVLTMLANTYGTWPLPPKEWPYKTWLALLHTYDNLGPPRPQQVREMVERIRRQAPGAEITVGRMSDFTDALREEKPEIPVVRGDMPDTWIHGPMSAPAGCKTARNCRPRIAAAEALGTLLLAWGADVPDRASTIAEAYENSLLYGEHTWGLNTLRYVELVYGDEWKAKLAAGLDHSHRLVEQSWDEHEAYINKARELAESLLEDHLGKLVRDVDVKGRRIVVFNPLPWVRDGIVAAPAQSVNFRAVKPVDGDQIEPVVANGGEMLFLARDIPALGYRTFVPADASPAVSGTSGDQAAATIESPFFRAVLDPKQGAIRSLVDKRSGRELVDSSAPHGFGQYLYERFGQLDNADWLDAYVHKNWHRSHATSVCKYTIPDVPYTAITAKDMALKVEQDAQGVSAVIEFGATETLPHDVSIRLRLYRDLPAVDLDVSFSKPPDPWPEAGWICLPVNVEQPEFRLGRLAGIVDPTKDIIDGTNFHLLWLNSGMTVTDATGAGLGICPVDTPVVSLGEPGVLRYSRRYEPEHGRVYVNLFNNHYNTNFRSWWGGKLTSRVRLWPVDRYDAESELVTPSWEARSPLLAAAFDGPAGTLPPSRAGLELSRKGILVMAFGPNPDGDGTILRLWEQAGQDGPCEIRLPEGVRPASIWRSDLRGRLHGEPIPVRDGKFEISLPPYAPATLLIGDGRRHRTNP